MLRTRPSKACWKAAESRKSVRRACVTTFPTLLNNRNRSRFGRAVRRSPGKVSRLSAVILLAMIPTLIVFVLLQRHYVRGVSEGAFASF